MSSTTVVPYENPDAKDLRARVEVARARLAEVEAAYTIDKAKVDGLQASLFQRLRTYRQERDRLRLIVDYRRQFLAGVLRGDEGEAERVKQAHQEAEARNEREYEETAQTLAAKKELTAEDEAELGKLWKSLVKLYHPDRFAHEPDKLDTYGKLTAAINRAKDNGDFATLRQIANDPHGFILKQGWVSLDFRDEEQAKRLAELYESLMAEIRSVHAARERLRQSPEFELYELTTKQPTMLDTVAEKQRKLLESEIAELNREAARLAGEIGKLTGNPPPGADDTPRARSPADEQEAAPPPPPPAQPEQRPSAAAAENLTGERNGQQPTTYVWYFCDRCRAENCTTDFFVGTRKACSHCGCEMIVPGTPTSNQSQHGEPREHPKAGPSASRTYYGMPEDEGYELRKWQHIRDRQKSTQVIRSIFYAIVGAFVGGMVGALACASLEFGDAGIGIAAFAIFGIGLGIRSARPKTIEQIAKKEARDYAKKYPSTTPTITTYVFAAIWWAFVGGFIGSFALLYFGEAAAGVGAWLGIILGIWLGIWSLKPSIRPPLPNSASVWDGKGWKTPKEIAEAKKDKPLSKTGEVIVGIIVFGILALIFGLPIACGAAALAWLTYSITTGIATATADEIEKRKKP